MPSTAQTRPPHGATSQHSPEEDAEYERIWRGDASGVSEHDVRADLSRHTLILQRLRSKTLRPEAVISSGFTQSGDRAQTAVASVAALLRADNTALETGGRSVPQNRALVRSRVSASQPADTK